MNSLASSPQIALAALAVGWPLALGLGVVIWSKVRAAAHAGKVRDLDARLRGLYRTVELREPPERLAMVVDSLEEQEALRANVAAADPQTRIGRRRNRQPLP